MVYGTWCMGVSKNQGPSDYRPQIVGLSLDGHPEEEAGSQSSDCFLPIWPFSVEALGRAHPGRRFQAFLLRKLPLLHRDSFPGLLLRNLI